MKYATIEYDFNRPSNKVLKEPLDSDYGIAVRVWKDGELVEGDLSVGGNSATTTSDTWQLFDLSTGSTPCTKNYEVECGEEGIFNLQVNEADLGYINVEEN